MKLLSGLALAGALGAASYASFLAWRAHTDLVTLHVRNAPLSDVISKLRWQTWETFIVKSDIKAAITLDINKMPLDHVLSIIGEQSNARWTTVYPIYMQKSSLKSLERALRGELPLADTAFTSYSENQFIRFRTDAAFRDASLVTLHLTNTDLAISALALQRFGRGQVLVEKSAHPKITLELDNTPFEKAVKKVANTVQRSTTRLYALEPLRAGGIASGPRQGRGGPERPIEPELDAQRKEKMEQMLATLPEEERKKAEDRQLERAAMQSLTPEQRQQVMSDRMKGPEMQARAEQRQVSGIKNTTPEQRRDRYERMYEMRKTRAARNG